MTPSPPPSPLSPPPQHGVREGSTISYNTSLGVIFGVKKYAQRLLKVVERKGIQVREGGGGGGVRQTYGTQAVLYD